MHLYHFSDQPGLRLFTPRPDKQGIPRVWAIAASHQQNYLLPRDCPRICLHARAETSAADKQRFLGDADWRIVVETGWLDRIAAASLTRYSFAPDGFVMLDANAGYHVCDTPVIPLEEQLIPDLPAAIAATGTQLDHQPCLWALREAVAKSTLGFSIIRMAHAASPPVGFVSRFPI